MKFKINNREVESYQLSNNEVLDLFTNPSTTDEEKEALNSIIIDRFTSDLCKKPGETEDDVFARFFGDFVNGRLCSRQKVAERMCTEHRYLQQEMFKVCLEYIKKLAENYGKGYYDGRNQWACETSSLIVEAMTKICRPI